MARTKERPAPARRPLPDHLARGAVAAAVVVVVVMLVIAALATSRARAHVLTPLALVAIVAVAAATGVVVGWVNGLYEGAYDLLRGEAVLVCEPGCWAEPGDDPWATRALWRSALTWAALVALWAGAGGALVAVALDGRRAGLAVTFVALTGLTGTAAVVIAVVARHRGAHAARRVLALERLPQGIRRRAWLEVALPLGVTQFGVNAAAACLLFHDYAVHAAGTGPKVLTRTVALADVVIIVVLVASIFGVVASRWGRTDVLLGRVSLDDPAAQQATVKSPIGPQGLVYIGLLGLLLGKLASLVLPGTPTLLQVALARGVLGGVLAFAAAGAGYVRGAVNARVDSAGSAGSVPP